MTDHNKSADERYTILELADGHFLRGEELLSDTARFVRRISDDREPGSVDDDRTAIAVPKADGTAPTRLNDALPDRYVAAVEEGELFVERLTVEDVDETVLETDRDRPIGSKRLIGRLQDRYGTPAGVHRRRLIAYLQASGRSREEAERELERLRDAGDLSSTKGQRLRLE